MQYRSSRHHYRLQHQDLLPLSLCDECSGPGSFRPSSVLRPAHISLLLILAFAPGLPDNFARSGLSDKPPKHLQSPLCRPPNALRMLRTVDGGEYICCSDNDIDPAPEVDVWQICKLKLLSSRSIHYVCIIDHCSDCPRNGYSREISEAGDK